MRHPDKSVSTVGQLVKALESQTDAATPIWFRGQAKASWTLLPSLARSPKTAKAESALIKRFKQNAMPHLSGRPASEWEWMFLMQHYRLPTRLLDSNRTELANIPLHTQKQKGSFQPTWKCHNGTRTFSMIGKKRSDRERRSLFLGRRPNGS